jgi:CheY-like chemotaxis protein
LTRILVVDDELSFLRTIATALRSSGYETIIASDAETALALLESLQPDIMLIDVNLPGIQGTELATRVKEHPEHSDVPVILMSAYDRPHQYSNGFLPKPIDLENIGKLLEPYLQRAR